MAPLNFRRTRPSIPFGRRHDSCSPHHHAQTASSVRATRLLACYLGVVGGFSVATGSQQPFLVAVCYRSTCRRPTPMLIEGTTYRDALEAVRLVTLELGHLLLDDLGADDGSNLHHLQFAATDTSPTLATQCSRSLQPGPSLAGPPRISVHKNPRLRHCCCGPRDLHGGARRARKASHHSAHL